MLVPGVIGAILGLIIQSLVETSLTASSLQGGQVIFSMFGFGIAIEIVLYLLLIFSTTQNSDQGLAGLVPAAIFGSAMVGFAGGFFIPAIIWAVPYLWNL